MGLQDRIEDLRKAGIQVAAISFDKPEILKKFAAKRKITFPLLSDKGSETIKAFEIHFKRGLPYPGTFIVSPKGVVEAKIFNDGYVDRHSVDQLIEAVPDES